MASAASGPRRPDGLSESSQAKRSRTAASLTEQEKAVLERREGKWLGCAFIDAARDEERRVVALDRDPAVPSASAASWRALSVRLQPSGSSAPRLVPGDSELRQLRDQASALVAAGNADSPLKPRYYAVNLPSVGMQGMVTAYASRHAAVGLRVPAVEPPLHVGDGIEVLWFMANPDEDEASAEDDTLEVWWPAKVARPAEQGAVVQLRAGSPREDLSTWVLRYAALPEHSAPEPQDLDVAFLSPRALVDLASGDAMQWRRAGATDEPLDLAVELGLAGMAEGGEERPARGEEDEGDDDDSAAGCLAGFTDIDDEGSVMVNSDNVPGFVERLLGHLLEGPLGKRMSSLTATHQAAVADRFLAGKAALTASLEQLLAQKLAEGGPDRPPPPVTVADVQAIVASLASELH